MIITDRLIQDTKKKADKASIPDDDDDMDEYMDRKSLPYLNEEKSVFDRNSFEGINTAKSVFDRQAVFRVKE